MSNKSTQIYVCEQCGNETTRWVGRCPICGTWNSMKEVKFATKGFGSGKSRRPRAIKIQPVSRSIKSKGLSHRLSSEIKGLDYVLGNGFVQGETVLLSGEPGIGKSTLLLLACKKMADNGKKVIFFSAEESEDQVVSRLDRIKCCVKKVYSDVYLNNLSIVYSTNIDEIIATIEKEQPDVVVLDSIQSVSTDDLPSGAGSLSQVRESAMRLNNIIKQSSGIGVIVGQVTKGGLIAGPKVLEHLVDCVLYFEGDKVSELRVLKTTKNRFGSTNEIAFFRMASGGIEGVDDPSKFFISSNASLPGIARTVIMHGERPVVIEVQALLNKSYFGYPKRVSEGFSKNRLELLSAILHKSLKLNLSQTDVYINVLGGIKVKDPGMDLAVCAAILSAHKNKPVKEGYVLIGEVSLAGQIKGVTKEEQRYKEALRTGAKCIIGNKLKGYKKVNEISYIRDFPKIIF